MKKAQNTKNRGNTDESTQWNGPSATKPNPRTVRTAHVSVLMTVYNFSAKYSIQQFWQSPFIPPDNHHSSEIKTELNWQSSTLLHTHYYINNYNWQPLKLMHFLTQLTVNALKQ